mmetsp:Transcript_107844/g.348044  ORF Transcript_107844/g.348044 Transcript_107844/m.348044 type:complete len:420 (-) Transcript_107844:317-1576(-)
MFLAMIQLGTLVNGQTRCQKIGRGIAAGEAREDVAAKFPKLREPHLDRRERCSTFLAVLPRRGSRTARRQRGPGSALCRRHHLLIIILVFVLLAAGRRVRGLVFFLALFRRVFRGVLVILRVIGLRSCTRWCGCHTCWLWSCLRSRGWWCGSLSHHAWRGSNRRHRLGFGRDHWRDRWRDRWLQHFTCNDGLGARLLLSLLGRWKFGWWHFTCRPALGDRGLPRRGHSCRNLRPEGGGSRPRRQWSNGRGRVRRRPWPGWLGKPLRHVGSCCSLRPLLGRHLLAPLSRRLRRRRRPLRGALGRRRHPGGLRQRGVHRLLPLQPRLRRRTRSKRWAGFGCNAQLCSHGRSYPGSGAERTSSGKGAQAGSLAGSEFDLAPLDADVLKGLLHLLVAEAEAVGHDVASRLGEVQYVRLDLVQV